MLAVIVIVIILFFPSTTVVIQSIGFGSRPGLESLLYSLPARWPWVS